MKFLQAFLFLSLCVLSFSSQVHAAKPIVCQLELLSEEKKNELAANYMDMAFLEFSKKKGLENAARFVLEIAQDLRAGKIKTQVDATQKSSLALHFFAQPSINGVKFHLHKITLSNEMASALFKRDPSVSKDVLFSNEAFLTKREWSEFLESLASIYQYHEYKNGRLRLDEIGYLTEIKTTMDWGMAYLEQPKNEKNYAPFLGRKAFDFIKEKLSTPAGQQSVLLEFSLVSLQKISANPSEFFHRLHDELKNTSEKDRQRELFMLKQLLEQNLYEAFYSEFGRVFADYYLFQIFSKEKSFLKPLAINPQLLESMRMHTEQNFLQIQALLNEKFEPKAGLSVATTEEIKKFDPKKSN